MVHEERIRLSAADSRFIHNVLVPGTGIKIREFMRVLMATVAAAKQEGQSLRRFIRETGVVHRSVDGPLAAQTQQTINALRDCCGLQVIEIPDHDEDQPEVFSDVG